MGIYMGLTFGVCMIIYLVTYTKKNPKLVFNSHHIGIDTKKVAFILTFLVLAIFSAIRDDCGCDYESYILHIRRIQAGMPDYMEIGFQKVVLWLEYLDKNPRLVIMLFSALTVFFFLKAIWDQSDNILFSVFIFMSWGYYFMTFNTIRNYFSLALVLYAIKFLNDKKYLRFVLIVIVASLFHKSALVCIPIYLLAKKKYNDKHVLIFLAITLGALLLKDKLRNVVFLLYPGYMEGVYDTGRASFLNIFKAIVTILFCLIYNKKIKEDSLTRFYFNLNVFALMFYVGMYWTPEVSRIGFYMNATTILLIPRVVNLVSVPENRRLYKLVIVIFSVILFVLLLNQFSSPTTRLLPYKTWYFNGEYNNI